MPAEIGQLSNLRYLYLWENQLVELPPQIGHLENLESLDLTDNPLPQLPPELGQLAKVSLKIDRNKLSTVPPEIEQLLPGIIETGQSMTLTQTYLDEGNVYVVTDEGTTVQLTTGGLFYAPQLADNQRTIGWQVVTEHPVYERGPLRVSQELVIYQDGQIIKRLPILGIIRQWTFWNNARQVAIYSGGLHFSGGYELIDIQTGEVLETSGDLDDAPPDWALIFRGG